MKKGSGKLEGQEETARHFQSDCSEINSEDPHQEHRVFQCRGQETISLKSQTVKMLAVVGHMVSAATIQLYCDSLRVAIDNTSIK